MYLLPDNFNQRGFTPIALVVLLLLGIAAGTLLVQNRTNFLPKAAWDSPFRCDQPDANNFDDQSAKNYGSACPTEQYPKFDRCDLINKASGKITPNPNKVACDSSVASSEITSLFNISYYCKWSLPCLPPAAPTTCPNGLSFGQREIIGCDPFKYDFCFDQNDWGAASNQDKLKTDRSSFINPTKCDVAAAAPAAQGDKCPDELPEDKIQVTKCANSLPSEGVICDTNRALVKITDPNAIIKNCNNKLCTNPDFCKAGGPAAPAQGAPAPKTGVPGAPAVAANTCTDPETKKGYAAGGKRYACSNTRGPCLENAGVGVPFVCTANGSWTNPNPAGECTTDCKPGTSPVAKDSCLEKCISTHTLDSAQCVADKKCGKDLTRAACDTLLLTCAQEENTKYNKCNLGCENAPGAPGAANAPDCGSDQLGLKIPCYIIGTFTDRESLDSTIAGATLASQRYDQFKSILDKVGSSINKAILDRANAKLAASKAATDACLAGK